MKPSIEDIQNVIRLSVMVMQSYAKGILKWADVGRYQNIRSTLKKSQTVSVMNLNKASRSEGVDSDKAEQGPKSESDLSPNKLGQDFERPGGVRA